MLLTDKPHLYVEEDRMLGNLLEKKLKEQKDRNIIVVMNDNLAFRGKLTEFDKDTLVLQEVYQASATEINWEEMKADGGGEEKTCVVPGCIEWTDVDLEEVFIQVDHVSRIWPRNAHLEEKADSREVIYHRKEPLGLNRAVGLDVRGEMK